MIKPFAATFAVAAFAAAAFAAASPEPAFRLVKDIPYYSADKMASGSAAMKKKCFVNVRVPNGVTNFPTVVWYHGGGLVNGGRGGYCQICRDPASGIGGVSVGYRFLTEAKPAEVLEDAAAALAWTLKHIAEYGGDPKKVFVSGSSAGGYLTAMMGMDPKWLAPHGFKPSDLAGLMPETGQMTTHFNVRKFTGDPTSTYITKVDEWAPAAYARGEGLSPICLMVGEDGIDMLCRAEENRLLYASLLALGHRDVEYHTFAGRRHGTMSRDAGPYELSFLRRHEQLIDGTWRPTGDKVLDTLEDFVAKKRIAGVVSILSDDRYNLKVDCAGFADLEKRQPILPDTVFAIFSMTKTFAGAAFMCAIDDGKISLDDPVSKYLPEFADVKMKDGSKPKRAVTLRDLLSHVSGFRGGYPLVNCDKPQREVARLLAATPLASQPGEAFSYNTATFSAAAAALEVAVGVPFEKYIFERITDPLGMKDTTFTPKGTHIRRMVKAYTSDDKVLRPAADTCARQIVFPKKNPLQPAAGGGLFSTPNDMIRFSQMLAHHGEWKGHVIISRKTFDEIFSVIQTPASLKKNYTVGAWLYDDWFGHEGAMRTDQRANLKTGHSRVFFIQTENKAGSAFFELKKAWNAACDEYQHTPSPFIPEN